MEILLVLTLLNPKHSMVSQCLFPYHHPKDHMLTSKLSILTAKKQNWEPSLWFSIFSGQDFITWMFQDEILILTFLPIDEPTASALTEYEAATLAHESWSNSVIIGTLVCKHFLSIAYNMYILRYL